jgi:hypothetical protein
MTSGPKRRDAAKGDQRSPEAMDLKLAGIRVARFPGEQCGHHGRWGIAATHRGAVGDAADQLRRFSGTLSVAGPCDRRGAYERRSGFSEGQSRAAGAAAGPFLAQRCGSNNGCGSGIGDGRHRLADPRNRRSSTGHMGRNFCLGENSQRRRVCRARPLEGRVWSDGNLDRTTRLTVFAATPGWPLGGRDIGKDAFLLLVEGDHSAAW